MHHTREFLEHSPGMVIQALQGWLDTISDQSVPEPKAILVLKIPITDGDKTKETFVFCELNC